jgi:hypothetical protein
VCAESSPRPRECLCLRIAAAHCYGIPKPMSFKEFDTVVMKADMPSHGLKIGDVGAVVQVYSAPVPGTMAHCEPDLPAYATAAVSSVTGPLAVRWTMTPPSLCATRLR